MDRGQFLKAIFEFFRVKDENQSLYRAYDIVLSKGRNIDWDKLYTKTLEDVETKFLPLPVFFIKRFEDCHKIDKKQAEHAGNKVRVFYKNGRFTDYTCCNNGSTLNDILKKFYGDWSVQEVRLYPKTAKLKDENGKLYDVEVALVGANVFPENTPYKILYARA